MNKIKLYGYAFDQGIKIDYSEEEENTVIVIWQKRAKIEKELKAADNTLLDIKREALLRQGIIAPKLINLKSQTGKVFDKAKTSKYFDFKYAAIASHGTVEDEAYQCPTCQWVLGRPASKSNSDTGSSLNLEEYHCRVCDQNLNATEK